MAANGREEQKEFPVHLESGRLVTVNSSKRCWNFDGRGLNLTLFPHIWIPADASSRRLLQEGSGQEMRKCSVFCGISIRSIRTSRVCFSQWTTKHKAKSIIMKSVQKN